MVFGVRNEAQLGQAIRRERRGRGWTQAVVAQRAGVSRNIVIDLERGSRPGIEVGRVFAVLRALDIELTPAVRPVPSYDDLLADLVGPDGGDG